VKYHNFSLSCKFSVGKSGQRFGYRVVPVLIPDKLSNFRIVSFLLLLASGRPGCGRNCYRLVWRQLQQDFSAGDHLWSVIWQRYSNGSNSGEDVGLAIGVEYVREDKTGTVVNIAVKRGRYKVKTHLPSNQPANARILRFYNGNRFSEIDFSEEKNMPVATDDSCLFNLSG